MLTFILARLKKLQKNKINYLIITIILVIQLTFIYAHKIEPGWFEVIRINLKLAHMSQVFNNFKIVQISDIHVGEEMNQVRLQKIIKLINQEKPDIIAITGDFVTERPKKKALKLAHLLTKELKELQPQIKTLAVLGNHDHYWNGSTLVRKILVDSNILELNNDIYTIKRKGQKLNFAGLDDTLVGNPDFHGILRELPNDGGNILLVHEPDFAIRSAKSNKFDLQLSGHSHGGQIRIPLIGALVLPKLAKKYPLGLYQVKNTLVYTNRGLGMVILQLRFCSRPEITVFTLKSSNS